MSWEYKKLGEVLDLQNGYAFNSKLFAADGEIGLIRIRDIKQGINTETRYTGEYDTKYIVHSGDFLIGMDGEFSCYEWRGKPSLLNQRVCRLQDFSKSLHPKFLFYGINKHLKEIEDATAFTTVKHISSRQIKDIRFPIPPISEQKRIVEILDEAFEGIDAAIANTEKNLANARELFWNFLNEIFSCSGTRTKNWKEVSLVDVCSITSSLVDPREEKYLDLPHIGAGNLVSASEELVDVKTAREECLISGKFLFDDSMILYSKIRPYLMKVCRPDFSGLCSADMYPLLPTEGVLDKNFLFFLLLSKHFTDYAVLGSARAGMPKVNREHLFKYKFLLPDYADQNTLAGQLDVLGKEVERIEESYKNKKSLLRELKQSLLQKAFRGELTADNVVAFAPKAETKSVIDTQSPEFTAHLIAFGYHWHEGQGRQKTYGRVKAQKFLHFSESQAKIEMGRKPIKDAAGPNDLPHMIRGEEWARSNQFFELVKRKDGVGYDFKKLPKYNQLIQDSLTLVSPYKSKLEKLLSILLPLDTEKSEVLATVYAAWNNLLLDRKEISDDDIIREARNNWHLDKLKIPENLFRKAISDIRQNGILPDGTAKRVVGQESLL